MDERPTPLPPDVAPEPALSIGQRVLPSGLVRRSAWLLLSAALAHAATACGAPGTTLGGPEASAPVLAGGTTSLGAHPTDDGKTDAALPATDDTAAIPLWKDGKDHPRGYLGDEAPDGTHFLPPPPAPGSPGDATDRAIEQKVRALQGSARWQWAARDNDLETPVAPRAFECALGVTFDPATMPILTRLLARVTSDVGAGGERAKQRFARKRPYAVAETTTCIPPEARPPNASYPSGHAATGWAWALVLMELAPDRAEAVARRGIAFGDSRVVCGIHYASDVDAGRLVGATVIARLRAEPAFVRDLARARTELAAARTSATQNAACAEEEAVLANRGF
ncbi:acid phosphatase [Chondromyces crocatus]|uniref:Phosphatidic acid phosphatase type 2/haloperoxidase domain-containing protein n=1 Tax=Chondromyces crocatus TaxID=52 RepID=A0A0K1EP69_CHOCO|nr:phosphatase PAP2 family protein [Chondromyces crocatus]AKT42604.1 uncharacterized protein CMC5_068310 [Chondromyces crocatus]